MKNVIPFLTELKNNNNREWFQANKKKYDLAKTEFETFVNKLIVELVKLDPQVGQPTAKECVFRIFRDVRFSADKSPYKTNMGGYISRGGRKGGFAGYYIHIDPEASFLAGGLYMPPADILKKVRQEIMYNVDEFKGIIQKSTFQKTYGQIEGEMLTRPPKDFPADFPDIDLLKFKSYTVLHSVDGGTITGPNFIDYAMHVFKELKPFNHFLNRAME